LWGQKKQTISSGWQTVYSGLSGDIQINVIINDPLAIKNKWTSGFYFKTNISSYVQVSIAAKEWTASYNKTFINEYVQGGSAVFLKGVKGWRESGIGVGPVISYKGLYIKYLKIGEDVIYQNGQRVGDETNQQLKKALNLNKSTGNDYNNSISSSDLKLLINTVNDKCKELEKMAFDQGGSSVLANNCGKTYETRSESIPIIKNDISKVGAEIHRLRYSNNNYQSQQQFQNQQEQQNQKIAQENARRSEEEKQRKLQRQQEYNNSSNQAQNSLNNGDWNEAANNYNNAIKSANTKGERNVAAIGALGSVLGGVFDGIAKDKEAKRKKDEEKRRKEKEEKEKFEREQQNTVNRQDADWDKANNLADLTHYDQAINIMLPYASSDKLNGMALNEIGFWYWKLQDYNNAIYWYRKGVMKQDANAMYNLGVMFENGWGTERNIEAALHWYDKACEKGYDNACQNKAILEKEENSELALYSDYALDKFIKKGYSVKFIATNTDKTSKFARYLVKNKETSFELISYFEFPNNGMSLEKYYELRGDRSFPYKNLVSIMKDVFGSSSKLLDISKTQSTKNINWIYFEISASIQEILNSAKNITFSDTTDFKGSIIEFKTLKHTESVSGKYKFIYTYQNGKIIETKTYNIENGKLEKQTFNDKNGNLKQSITFYENGEKFNDTLFKDGTVISNKVYDENGNLEMITDENGNTKNVKYNTNY